MRAPATTTHPDLLFDLGGVIMDIDRDRCVSSFMRLGFSDVGDYLGAYVQKGLFSDLESGLVTPGQWRAEIHRHLPPGVNDAAIDAAFEDFLLGIPPERLRELRRLRADRHVYLLSNTNPVMWSGKIARSFQDEGLTLTDYFDGVVTSFEAKAMKPDRAIFDYAVSHLGLTPATTLFLDDSQANLDAASALGFQTALVPPGSEFKDIIARHEHN